MIVNDEHKVYCLDNSELSDWEALNKGYRSDVYVRTNDHYYLLSIYDIVRLQQDFETEISEYGFYSVDPNLVIVPEVEWGHIKQTIGKLILQSYFKRILPVLDSEVPIPELKEK